MPFACVRGRPQGIMLAGADSAPVGLAACTHKTGGTTAAPQTLLAAFSLAAFRSLGRIAPTVFMMSAPSGKPSGLPFPVLRSANLLGAALPLAGEDGSQI